VAYSSYLGPLINSFGPASNFARSQQFSTQSSGVVLSSPAIAPPPSLGDGSSSLTIATSPSGLGQDSSTNTSSPPLSQGFPHAGNGYTPGETTMVSVPSAITLQYDASSPTDGNDAHTTEATPTPASRSRGRGRARATSTRGRGVNFPFASSLRVLRLQLLMFWGLGSCSWW